ncbi:enoyl-CoA hydratase/isomerase family protein [Pseudonocardia sp. GCM10023141]|uniref:enoyl-CoA hydratase/isomerase family protein n=1 Tax=Pseudonocardia sp. GCM10023141 TaxID=3252653 RepID=UPI00361E6070
MPVSCTVQGGIAVLGLEPGRGGAIGPAFLDALHTALDEVERADARAVVLTGRGRVFCGALDLAAVQDMDRAALDSVVDAVDTAFRRVFAFDRPTVAAINGHAIAGGCVLAMACDVRVMAEGQFRIGVNEVQFGLPLPATGFEILRHAVPSPLLSWLLLQGRQFAPAEAQRLGLVHQVAGERGPMADAMDEARAFATAGRSAVRALKRDLTAPVLDRIAATREARRARFLDHWFAAETQARLERFRQRS